MDGQNSHRFQRNFAAFGGCFSLFGPFFGFMAYMGGQESLAIALIVGAFLLIALPFFLYRSSTVFSDATQSLTYKSGMYPWLKTRQILYRDVEKLVLDGRTLSGKGQSADYEVKLLVRGDPTPIRIASYDESEIRRNEPIVLAVAAASGIALEKTPRYEQTREKYDGTRVARNVSSRYTLAASLVSLAIGGYVALAHSGTPVPFQAALESLFHMPMGKGNVGQAIVSIGPILGVALAMIGIATYMQTKS